MSRMNWRKQKTLAMLTNRRQWERDFSPQYSTEEEIMTEAGVFLRTEDSTSVEPNYYRTE